MAAPLSLEILIKTILDNRGVAAADADIKKLSESMKAAAQEGKPLETSVDAVTAAFTKQQAAGKEVATVWEKMTEAQKADQRASAQSAVAMLQNDDAKRKAADASKLLTKELGALKLAGEGTRKVMNGLAQGGIGGLITAASGANDIFRAMGTGLTQVGRGLAIASAAAAPLIVAIAAMKKISGDNESAMERMWAAGAKGAETYAARFKEVTAQVEADSDRQLAAIEKVISANDRLLASNAKADQREAAKFAAQKELALAEAKTPEERAAVEARFGGIAQDNRLLDAGRDEKQAQDQLAQLRYELDQSNAALREAEQRAEQSKQDALGYGDSNAPAALAARQRAFADRDAVATARTARDEQAVRIAQDQQANYDIIEGVRNSRELVGINRQTSAAQQRQSVTPAPAGPTVSAPDPRIARDLEVNLTGLRARAQEQMLARDYTGQSSTIVEIQRAKKALSEQNAALKSFARAAADGAESTSKEVQAQKRRLDNTAESRAGQ